MIPMTLCDVSGSSVPLPLSGFEISPEELSESLSSELTVFNHFCTCNITNTSHYYQSEKKGKVALVVIKNNIAPVET